MFKFEVHLSLKNCDVLCPHELCLIMSILIIILNIKIKIYFKNQLHTSFREDTSLGVQPNYNQPLTFYPCVHIMISLSISVPGHEVPDKGIQT